MVTIVVWPIIAALLQASVFINVSDVHYRPVNPVQELFFEQYYPKKNELSQFKEQELRNWVSRDYEELNAILKKEGFSIQLAPFKPNEFGVVSILDILVEWMVEGTKTDILDPDTHIFYPAVKIEDENDNGSDNFIMYQSSLHEHPIVCLQTKSGDTVWMTVADQKRVDFELLEHIEHIKKGLVLERKKYATVTFPMIDFDEQSELGWLFDLELGLNWYIAQALQQTKLKMNEKGAHVNSAVAIAVLEMSCGDEELPLHLIIDKPFYLWIERKGVTSPIFAGYIDQAYWKDPGTLDMN